MKLDKKPEVPQGKPYLDKFSKVADLKIPDSPPPEPEKEEDDGDPNKPNKFEQLMKAACSIKETELQRQRRKFELLPAFLKAGVYYTTKLESVRQQDYFQRAFAYELLIRNANQEYYRGQHDSACRRYEEAYSMWRYYYSTNPNWNKEGIDDFTLREVVYAGNNEWEKQQIHKHKQQSLMNMVACNIKIKNYEDAMSAVNEVLLHEPNNTMALYRRAKARSQPINAGVPDLRLAVKDLKAMNSSDSRITKEIARLQKMIDVNAKREKNTYANMFIRDGKQGEAGESVTEYVDKVAKQKEIFKTMEDKEVEREMQKIDKEVELMIEKKKHEFSFEINPKLQSHPEIESVSVLIEKAVDNYKLFKKVGQMDEAKMMKEKIREMKYAQQHLLHVMNLDFTRPTEKMKTMAEKANINLKDSKIQEEFKLIQKQNLEDIRRMKEGKEPLTEEEAKAERGRLLSELQEKRLKTELLKHKKESDKQMESTEKIVKMIEESKQNLKTSKQQEEEMADTTLRDLFILSSLLLVWLLAIFSSQYHQIFNPKKTE